MRARIASLAVVAAALAAGCGGGDANDAKRVPGTPRAPSEQAAVVWAMPVDDVERLPASEGLRALDAARVLARSDWDAYYATVLLVYLDEERGIDLFSSRYSRTIERRIREEQEIDVFFFTDEHRRRYGRRLARLRPSRAELARYYEKFTEETDPHAAEAMQSWLDGIRKGVAVADARTVGVMLLLE